jgi:hypothetical protein
MRKTAAIIYAVLMGLVVLFQFCLTLGLPWGEASMGGKYPGTYPLTMRFVSFLNMIILSCMTVIVLVKAELLFPQLKSFSIKAIWFVVGFSAVTVILNLITPSQIERQIWAPDTVIQLITSILVALK